MFSVDSLAGAINLHLEMSNKDIGLIDAMLVMLVWLPINDKLDQLLTLARR